MVYESTTDASGVGTPTHVVVGLFNDPNDAHQAVTQLRESGFSSSQIGAAFRGQSAGAYTNPGGAGTAGGTVKHEAENWWDKVKDAFRSDDKVETRSDVATDPKFDNNLDTGSDARGEYEYDLADDDFQGSLAGTGIPSDRAAYLSRSLRAGGAIVTVRDADRAAEAEAILSANHGEIRYEDVSGTGVAGADVIGTDQARAGYLDATTPGTGVAGIDSADSTGREITDTGYTEPRADSANTAVERVQLFGEVLRVHKERINRGEVRIRKEVITENQTIEVPVTREELVLERVAVTGNTPAPSANIGRSQEIRVPLTEETVRVEKQPVLREEVLVGKKEVADVARVGDEVRHEELRVDSDVDTPGREVTGEEAVTETRRRG